MAKIRKRHKRWQIDYHDPTGKRVRKSFATKKEAEAELGKRVSLIAEGRYLDIKQDFRYTLGELAARYEKNYSQQANWRGGKKGCVKRYLEYFGTKTLLAAIRYYDIETYRNELRQKPTIYRRKRADSTINAEMSCLHHMFTKAVEWEMVERSPFERGRSLLVKENNMRLRYLTEAEIPRLLEQCPRYLRNIVICALNTGMRKGEILSLEWGQIRGDFIYLQKTKTNESRQIPINDSLALLFQEIRREQQLRSSYVFTYAVGEEKMIGKQPINKRKKPAPVPRRILDLKNSFKKALSKAGIDDFRFHDLRHTFASQMIMKGAGLKDVQEILGHKTVTMTLRYAHLSQEHKKRAVNLLNGLTALPNSRGVWSQMVTNAPFQANSRNSTSR